VYDTISYYSGEADRCLETRWRFGAYVMIYGTRGVYGRSRMISRLFLRA
jgi:hypothetical protein